MLDFVKRICIALALATFIGMLFLGTMTTFAAEFEDDHPNELMDSLIWPTVGDVTDTYGTRGGKHYGVDLAAPEGTPVVAIADGTVSRSYHSDSYGQVVFIEHNNGLETVYAHLSHREVSEGQAVHEGEMIGAVGDTGRSSGNHLHFEVHHGKWNPEKSDSIDPLLVLSNTPEAMYASQSEHESPSVREWRKEKVLSAMKQVSHQEDEQEEIEGEAVQAEPQPVVHVPVNSGDTLWEIAAHFQVTVAELKEWNGLDHDVINVGEVLSIYPSEADYVVNEGDTLSEIAKKHGVTTEAIMKENQLRSDLIFPGQSLSIQSNQR